MKPTKGDVWDCLDCGATAPARYFDEVDGRDDLMQCPDCGGKVYEVIGTFEF